MAQDEFNGLVAPEESGCLIESVNKDIHPLKNVLLARISTVTIVYFNLLLVKLPNRVSVNLFHNPRSNEMLYQDIHGGDKEEHLDGRKIRSLAAFKIIAYHVSGAVDEVPKGARKTSVA